MPLLTLTLLALFSRSPATALPAQVSAYQPFRGDAVVVSMVKEPESVLFASATVPFFKYRGSWRVVFGIPITKPARAYDLRIKFKSGEVFEKQIAVRAKPGKPPKVALGIPQKLNLTPQKLVSRLSTQNNSINKVVSVFRPQVYFNQPFGLALRDNRKISSVFGEIRQTGGQEIRHLGVDFDAKKGAPVYAINAGVVRQAYTDEIYGNSIILDHGAGIFSLYLHLDKMFVKAGQKVKKGQRIAAVGESGYATQPHLHLSLKINGVPVDPVRFVNAFK